MQKIIYAIVIIVMATFFMKSCNRQMDIDSWPSTQAVITSYSIEAYQESKTRKSTNGNSRTTYKDSYRVRFNYNFQLNDIDYYGNFYVTRLDKQSEIDRVLKRNPNGKKINIKYDAQYPSDSVHRS